MQTVIQHFGNETDQLNKLLSEGWTVKSIYTTPLTTSPNHSSITTTVLEKVDKKDSFSEDQVKEFMKSKEFQDLKKSLKETTEDILTTATDIFTKIGNMDLDELKKKMEENK